MISENNLILIADKNFIENGMNIFLRYPQIAGVIPRIITLEENGYDNFEFSNDLSFTSGIYSSNWFFKFLKILFAIYWF